MPDLSGAHGGGGLVPTREQIERSKKRNRERHSDMDVFVREATQQPTAADLTRYRREADAGPRFAPKYDNSLIQVGMHDAWGGPTPPEAA